MRRRGCLSLKLSDISVLDLTPSMAQYARIKAEHRDCLVFFQMGDFYELFFEDAAVAAAALGIALTKRGRVNNQPIPMCGIPIHAAEMYLSRLLKEGHCVALCRQEEESGSGKAGLIERKVKKIFTPGTTMDDFLLDSPLNNFLMVIARNTTWGIALLDSSTGDVFIEEKTEHLLKSSLISWNPAEILVPFSCMENTEIQSLKQLYKGRLHPWPDEKFSFSAVHMDSIYGPSGRTLLKQISPSESAALKAAHAYAAMALTNLSPLQLPVRINQSCWMHIDPFTRKNLELHKGNGEDPKACLLNSIDRTTTPMGKRLLSQKLFMPDAVLEVIEKNLDSVAGFYNNPLATEKIRAQLKNIRDLERSLCRINAGIESPKDLQTIKTALFALPEIRSLGKLLSGSNTQARFQFDDNTDAFKRLSNMLGTLLKDSLPPYFQPAAVICAENDAELQRLETLGKELQKDQEALEAQYKIDLASSSLRIKSNALIGAYVELSKKSQTSLPPLFFLKQDLAQARRYTTQELEVLNAKKNKNLVDFEKREKKIFKNCLDQVRENFRILQGLSRHLAVLDLDTSFAHLAQENGYVRPRMTLNPDLKIKAGRHPVIEQCARNKPQPQTFSANDCCLDRVVCMKLITAPNMAGKSTYLRQNALIAIMAHIGSFVPAEEALVGRIDRLFSRIGTHDDLGQGQSTFMVEMLETAHILRYATKNSLVILDEVGRGTSTTDGIAIAQSCMSYLSAYTGCRTLFATHYKELADLADNQSLIKNYTLDVRVEKNELVFLHRVKPGKTKASYGLEIARIAGLPKACLAKAVCYKDAAETQSEHLNLLRALQEKLTQSTIEDFLKNEGVIFLKKVLQTIKLKPSHTLAQGSVVKKDCA